MLKLTIRFIFLVIVFSFFSNNVLTQSKTPVFIQDSIDNYINREMRLWNIPGAAVCIVKDGKVVLNKGYGVRKSGSSEKINENTLFMIASNTKAFTGTALALLEYQKRLALDDKVTKWLPYFSLYDSAASKEATIRDMLTHRVGFYTFQGDFLHWNSNLSRYDLIYNLRNIKPRFAFRSRYGYFNMGFVTAGEVLHAVTDTTWEEFIDVHFLKPLEMNRTSPYYDFLVKDENASVGHTLVDGLLIEIPYAKIENIAPCGALSSCVNDLAHWLMFQLDTGKYENERIIPQGAVIRTWQPNVVVNESDSQLFPKIRSVEYGLGWYLTNYNGKKIMSHTGGTNGFVTEVAFIPEEELGIAVLTNTDANSFYDALTYQIIEAYLDMPYRNLSGIMHERSEKYVKIEQGNIEKMRVKAASNPSPELDLTAYAGKYFNQVYGEIEIKVEEDSRRMSAFPVKVLNVYFPHHPGVIGKLEPLGGNDFLCTYTDVVWGVKKISFKVENGAVKSVTIKVNDFIDYYEYVFDKL